MVQTNIKRFRKSNSPLVRFKLWARKHIPLCAGIGIAAILLIGGSAFVCHKYEKKAALHTTIAGAAVGNQNQTQLTKTIEGLRSNIKLSLKYNGKSVTASADDLGIKFKTEDVAKKALTASHANAFAILFGHSDVKLAGSYDKTKVKSYIERSFPELVTKPVDATIAYSGDLNKYVVQPSSQGKSVKMDGVYAAVDKLLSAPKLSSYTITVDTAAPSISDESAQHTVDELNRGLNAVIAITNNGKTLWTIDPWTIADWANLQPDTATGIYTVTYNKSKIKSFLNSSVVGQLSNRPVNEQAIADKDGNVIRVISVGRNGQMPNDIDSVTGAVYDAVSSHRGATVEMTTKDTKYGTDKVIAKDNHWIEANLSDYSVKLYDGQNIIWQTNDTSHGKDSTPTVTGLFTVWRKTQEQCMPNPPSTTPLCHIHWVTYFEKSGYAFHEGWWLNGSNIRHGISHGCINMLVDGAKKVYDWSSIGTPVWVHW